MLRNNECTNGPTDRQTDGPMDGRIRSNVRVTTGVFTHLEEAQGIWPLMNKVESKHIGSLALVYFINNEDKAIAFRLRS